MLDMFVSRSSALDLGRWYPVNECVRKRRRVVKEAAFPAGARHKLHHAR
jgi:hypothetical protein